MSPISSSRSIAWRRQGAAIVGTLTLPDGRRGNVVLVGGRNNPKGAAIVLPGDGGGAPQTLPFAENAGLLHPQQAAELVCMQERAFGTGGLPRPTDLDG